MPNRNLLAAIAATIALFALPATGSAANYCVGSSAACTGSPVADFPASAAGITAAINAANAAGGDDVVHIAAGSYAITPTTFPDTTPSSDKLDVKGAGVGQTTFSGSAANTDSRLIYLRLPNNASTFSDFTLNATLTSPNFTIALEVQHGTVRDFDVNQLGSPTFNSSRAVSLDFGSSLFDGSVDTQGTVTGVTVFQPNSTVSNVRISGNSSGASIGLLGAFGSSGDYDRLRVAGFENGVRFDGGSANLTDSLVDMGAMDFATGVTSADQNSSMPSSVTLNSARNTIVGTGNSQAALFVATQEMIDSLTATAYDYVIYTTGSSVSALGCNGPNSSLNYEHLRYTGTVSSPSGGCSGVVPSDSVALVEDPFHDFANGDYTPAWNSDLVDAGGTTNDAPALDAAGRQRVVDGDGSGTATVDIGAFEYQRGAPVAQVIAEKTTLGLLEATTFTGSATDPEDEGLNYSWEIDGQPSLQTGITLSGGFVSYGTHTVKFTATDVAGASGSATVTVNVPAPSPPVVVPDPTAKVTAKAKKSFKRGSKGFAVAKKGAPFFTVTFANTAKATITLQSIGKKKKLKKLKGQQDLVVKQDGAVKIGFGGKWNRKQLAAGKYRVSVTPVSNAGTAGKPVTVDIKLK